MQIPVLGMDPSMSNWGLALAELNLSSGVLTTPTLSLVAPKPSKGKQVRQNSKDLERAEALAETVMALASAAKVIFVEVPVGSQSARAMASYGMCVGILGSLRAKGHQLIEVTPNEVKEAMTGKTTASKNEMIASARKAYPSANWPHHNGRLSASKAEHLADAIGSIHAGVQTPMFKNLMKLFSGI